MVCCCVPSCQIKKEKGCGVSFHHFPTDKELIGKWVLAISRYGGKSDPDWIPTKRCLVCSCHFKKTDYSTSTTRRTLLPHSVPSVFKTISTRCSPENVGSYEQTHLKVSRKRVKAGLSRAETEDDVEYDLAYEVTEDGLVHFEPRRQAEFIPVDEDPGEEHVAEDEWTSQQTYYSVPFCRLCAAQNENVVSVFEEEQSNGPLLEKIHTYLPIMMTAEDLLPTTVCEECVTKLEFCHSFVLGCLDADAVLKTIFASQNSNQAYCDDYNRLRTGGTGSENFDNINSVELKSQNNEYCGEYEGQENTVSEEHEGHENAVSEEYEGHENAVSEEYEGHENAVFKEYEDHENAVFKEYEDHENAVSEEYEGHENAVSEEYEGNENAVSEEYEGHENAVSEEYEGHENAVSEEYEGHENAVSEEYEGHENAVSEEYEGHENAVSEEYEDHENAVSEEYEGHENTVSEEYEECGNEEKIKYEYEEKENINYEEYEDHGKIKYEYEIQETTNYEECKGQENINYESEMCEGNKYEENTFPQGQEGQRNNPNASNEERSHGENDAVSIGTQNEQAKSEHLTANQLYSLNKPKLKKLVHTGKIKPNFKVVIVKMKNLNKLTDKVELQKAVSLAINEKMKQRNPAARQEQPCKAGSGVNTSKHDHTEQDASDHTYTSKAGFLNTEELSLHQQTSSQCSNAFQCKNCSNPFENKAALDEHSIVCGNSLSRCEDQDKVRSSENTSVESDNKENTMKNNVEVEVLDIDIKTAKKPGTFRLEQGCRIKFPKGFEHINTTHQAKILTAINKFIKKKLSDSEVPVSEPIKGPYGWKCRLCYETFQTSRAYRIHRQTHTPRNIPCIHCSRMFTSQRNLKQHLIIHTAEKKHMCEFCGKVFKLKDSLRIHYFSHGKGDKIYKCTQCGKSFASKYRYNQHLLRHGNAMYLCDVCGKSMKYPGSLRCHKLLHKQKTLYNCATCGKMYYSRQGLKVHTQIHVGEPPFACDKCGRHFETQVNLSEHKLVHTNNALYKCLTCGKCFKLRHQLKKHLTRHQLSMRYTCKLCQVTFSSMKELLFHRRSHAPVEVAGYRIEQQTSA